MPGVSRRRSASSSLNPPHFRYRSPSSSPLRAHPAFGGPEDVLAAIESARAAAPKWAALRPLERGKYLFRIARLIQERARELAVVEPMDGGKP